MHPESRRAVLLACLALAAPSCSGGGVEALASRADGLRPAAAPRLTPQASGTTQGLIAVSAVDERVVWVAGRAGTYAVTTDGGRTWHPGVVPGAEGLQFRDVQAFSDKVAYLLSIGTGTDSRIYRTSDGGRTWTMQFQNQDPDGFYDAFAFWDAHHAVTMADSINGRFPVVRTLDGRTWQDIGDRLPPALPGEAGFASSGTCAATFGGRLAWLVTGGVDAGRVLRTADRGQSWTAATSPLSAGPAGGGFSVAFRDRRHGILGGGDLLTPADVRDNFARSSDSGRTWQLGTPAPIPGAIFGLAYAGRAHGEDGDDGDEDGHARRGGEGREGAPPRVVATAPAGAAWSADEGQTWTTLEGVTGYWAVTFASASTGWLVGTGGTILRVDF